MSRLSSFERNRQAELLGDAPRKQMGALAFASERAIGFVAASLMTQLKDGGVVPETKRRLEYGLGPIFWYFGIKSVVDMPCELPPIYGNESQVPIPGFSRYYVN